MTEFKKGVWNLEELMIVEWIDKNQKGFMLGDVISCKQKILDLVKMNTHEGGLIHSVDVKEIIDQCFGSVEYG